jgi:hypothetical protein
MTGKSATKPMVTLPRDLGPRSWMDRPGRKFRAFHGLRQGCRTKVGDRLTTDGRQECDWGVIGVLDLIILSNFELPAHHFQVLSISSRGQAIVQQIYFVACGGIRSKLQSQKAE